MKTHIYDVKSQLPLFMNRLAIVAIILAITGLNSVMATTEIGFAGLTGWSNNYFLQDPQGWGLTVSQRVAKKISLSMTYNHLDNDFRYIGTTQFGGFPPPNPDTTRDMIRSDASADIFEISIHFTLVEDKKMRLEAGVGVGNAELNLHLKGESTGRGISSEKSVPLSTFAINATVKRFLWSPLAFKLGYQYRSMSAIVVATDGFEPFIDVTLSSVHAVLIAGW